MAKRWHQFVPGTAYNRDEVVAVCEMHLQSGRLRNPAGEEAWFDKIRRCPHDRLVWAPFGSSWGLSPMNPNAWRTETGEAIWERHVIPNVAKGQPVNPQPRAHSQADRMATTWLDGYYEALKFFYWEPQHIGRKKDVARPVIPLEKVTKHLRSIEVTLNHNINQFLLLAPIALRARLFHEFFERAFDSEFEMHGLGVDTDFASGNLVQPDFLFVSSGDVIAIEMKIKEKSSIEQVLKYALLGLAVEIKLGSPRRHHLGFLGVRDFSNQWNERFASPADLRLALDKADMSVFFESKGPTFVAQQQRFEVIVAELELSFLSYRDFAELLKSESPQPSDMSPAAEVYRNLISGLLSEFERRGLCV